MSDEKNISEPSGASGGSFSGFATFVGEIEKDIDRHHAEERNSTDLLITMRSRLDKALDAVLPEQRKTVHVPVGDSGDPEIETLTAVAWLMEQLEWSIRNADERKAAESRICEYVAARWK